MNHKIDCLKCFVAGEQQGEETGAQVEQERIIKLLEESTINAKHGVTPHGNSHFWEMGMKYAIALIKGEK